MSFDDTRTLLGAVERSFTPTTTLVDVFFPNMQTFSTEIVDMEFRKGGRLMAPFVVPGGKGVNMARTGSTIRSYKAPLMRPKRNIEPADILIRGFGESEYSTKTPEERAAEVRAHDLTELVDMCIRRQEWMAAQLLINGEYDVEGFADDGSLAHVDTISFPEFTNKTTLSGSNTWDNSTADILSDLDTASQKIRRAAGMIPTMAVCSSTVAKYIVNNTKLREAMMIPSRDNMALMSIQPQFVRPELLRVGYISALSLEIYAYEGGYLNEKGEFVPYIPDDYLILGVPGRGKRLFGAVTQIESDGQFHSYPGNAYVPKIIPDMDNDVSTLVMSSRCVLCPEFLDDWAVIKVK